MLLALLVSLIVAGAEPAAPTETQQGEVTAADPIGKPTVKSSRAGGDRLVCKREAKANSRFTTKVCKTVDEWDERTEAAEKAFGETQNRPTIMVCPPQGC